MTLEKLCQFSESELGIDFVAFTAVMCRSLWVSRVGTGSAQIFGLFVTPLAYRVRGKGGAPCLSDYISDAVVILTQMPLY